MVWIYEKQLLGLQELQPKDLELVFQDRAVRLYKIIKSPKAQKLFE